MRQGRPDTNNRIQTTAYDKGRQALMVKGRKINEIPFYLSINSPDESVTIPANGSASASMVNNMNGPVEIVRMGAQSTGVFSVSIQLEDGSEAISLMNNAIHSSTIFGSGAQPYILPEALYLPEGARLNLRFRDLSGSPNTVRLSFSSAQYRNIIYDPNLDEIKRRMRAKVRMSMPYFYTTQGGAVTLAGNANSQNSVEISASAGFLITHLSATSTDRFSINILDAQKGVALVDAPEGETYRLPSDLIVGSANFPFRFEQGLFFEPGSRMIVDLADLSGSTNVIYVTMGGIALTQYMWR